MLLYFRYIRMVTFLIAMLLLPTYLYSAMGQPGGDGMGEHRWIFISAVSQRADLGENRVSYLAETSDLIGVGKIIRVRTANEGRRDAVKQEVDQESDGRLVLTVTIEDVLKDTYHLGGASMLNVVAIPRQSDVKTLIPFDRHLVKATEEEKLKRSFEELTMGDQFVFFLKTLESSQAWEAREPENEVYPVYRYVNAIKAEPGAVELVKDYIHLAEIPDLNYREQALAEMAFSLLRNPETPVRIATDALDDLSRLRRKSAEKLIGEGEVEELVRITTDPKRPDVVRSRASSMLGFLIKDGRRVDPGPLLGMLEDSSDDVDLRLNIINRLEQINTLEVRQAVARILAEEPKTEGDKFVWRALAKSKLVK